MRNLRALPAAPAAVAGEANVNRLGGVVNYVIRQKGDRAALLMCVGGLALFSLWGFTKLFVGRHVGEYEQIIRLGGLKSWFLMVLVLVLVVTWLLGSVLGIAIAYRLREYTSLRCAAIAAALAIVTIILTNSGILTRNSREVWIVLVWLPLVATLVVIASSVLWLRERRLLPGTEAIDNE